MPIFKIFPAADPMFHKCREYVADKMSSIYSGWSNDYDSQFDAGAKYFTLIKGNNILAAAKIVFKNSDVCFPLSKASSKGECSLNFNHFDAEAGGVGFEDFTSVKTLFRMCSEFFLENSVGDILTCYDVSKSFTKRLYTKNFGCEIINDAIVFYNDFRHKENDKPVEWQLLIDKKETRPTRINKFNTRQGILSQC